MCESPFLLIVANEMSEFQSGFYLHLLHRLRILKRELEHQVCETSL